MKHFKTTLCSLMLAFTPFVAHADVVSSTTFGFSIEYKDGSQEASIIRYQAFVSASCDGSGSVSTWDHPFDTRRVKWRVDSWIQRDVCLVSKALGEHCDKDLRKFFSDTRNGSSREFDLFKGDLSHTTCSDVAGKIAAARDQLKKSIIDSLGELKGKDRDEVYELIKKDDRVKRIIPD